MDGGGTAGVDAGTGGTDGPERAADDEPSQEGSPSTPDEPEEKPRLIRTAGAEPYDCMIGEKLWLQRRELFWGDDN